MCARDEAGEWVVVVLADDSDIQLANMGSSKVPVRLLARRDEPADLLFRLREAARRM